MPAGMLQNLLFKDSKTVTFTLCSLLQLNNYTQLPIQTQTKFKQNLGLQTIKNGSHTWIEVTLKDKS